MEKKEQESELKTVRYSVMMGPILVDYPQFLNECIRSDAVVNQMYFPTFL